MITVEKLMDRLKGLSPDTVVCIGEQEEAFANNVVGVEVVRDARMGRTDADTLEEIELSHGQDTVLVLRW